HIEALISAWRVAPASVRRHVRVSRHFAPWLDRQRRERSREEARAAFLAEVRNGSASFDLLRRPLLPYQREGALRLAFGERGLLADLVCEGSIEHQILHLLDRKQALADGLLDGQGDLGTLKMPSSGRAPMMEQIEAIMRAPVAAAPRILPAEEAIAEELQRRHGERALLVEAPTGADGRVRLLTVLDLSADAL